MSKAQEQHSRELEERNRVMDAEEGLSASPVTGMPVEETPETMEAAYEAEEARPEPMFMFMEPVLAALVFFSMIGVLVRVYLTDLFTYRKQPIYALIWAQMIGCLVMGACMRLKGVLIHYSPALNVGITTGLCGSITTFSSWQLAVYEEFFNTNKGDHTRFKNFLGGISVLASTMACAIGALRFGQMAGEELRLAYEHYLRSVNTEATPLYRINTMLLGGQLAGRRRGWFGWDKWRFMDRALAVAGVLAVVAAVLVVALARSTRSVSIALLFGPLGTLLRWRLASLNAPHARLKHLTPSILLGLPFGTFAANVLGSATLAVIHILQTGVVVLPSAAACYVLAAVADGFCGCLTTVSTFAAEVSVLNRRRSVLYTAVSVVATQALFILIAGIYFKTATVDYAVC
ncbi:hypothetical protein GGI25_005453 [Coemansia spiralis]|uniref:Fluoride ion transporter CrcB n=2 Tax=Coemansia TaxID=4863 RepID=A0A9W8KVQ3_9FUNG|nr:CrcB-like protein-domain-containing protein [Coemansia spiralis]KAJ1988219.1 hypothetical protein EDC05_005419 [Coemansia umbellata]KAJ2619632.1 hypothetical protein GGI26_005686 [Coemansia sp. RSA 1358]KAJ2671586.1 hypothetical protein GGI25_005453 [Coemansia spiralis]